MISRRKFVAGLGAGAVAPGMLIGSPEDSTRSGFLRRVLADHPVAEPLFRPEPRTWSDAGITAAWIGHATVLLNFYGVNIITDPVFSERIGLRLLRFFTLGPKRLVGPPIGVGDLPRIDLILLSHAHMDHLDLPSLARFDRSIPVVMAKNTADVLGSLYFKTVTEVDWEERVTIAGVTIEGLKVRHFGWRFPWESDRSKGDWSGRSFNGYLLARNGKHVVFAGDTAAQEYFKGIAARGIDVDLALMPIGAYNPWIRVHASPEQAAAMARQMNARAILPIHWNTFTLSNEPQGEPIERLKAALARDGGGPSLALDAIGQTWQLPV